MRYVLPYRKSLNILYRWSCLYYYWMVILSSISLNCKKLSGWPVSHLQKLIAYIHVADSTSGHYNVGNIHSSGELGTNFYNKNMDYSRREELQVYCAIRTQTEYPNLWCSRITAEPKPLGRRGSLLSFVFITCHIKAHSDRM